MDILKICLLLVFIMTFFFIEENNINFSHSKSRLKEKPFNYVYSNTSKLNRNINFNKLKFKNGKPRAGRLTNFEYKIVGIKDDESSFKSKYNQTEIRKNITIYDDLPYVICYPKDRCSDHGTCDSVGIKCICDYGYKTVLNKKNNIWMIKQEYCTYKLKLHKFSNGKIFFNICIIGFILSLMDLTMI